MHGAYVYLIRQILQICILCFRGRHSGGNPRQNHISSEWKFNLLYNKHIHGVLIVRAVDEIDGS